MARFTPLTLALVLVAGLCAIAQESSITPAASQVPLVNPVRVKDAPIESQPRFLHLNRLPADVQLSLQLGAAIGIAPFTITSVPHWSSSFTTSGKKYGYTMVGAAPSGGATTHVATALLPLSFLFDAYKDSSGHKLLITPSAVLTKIEKSPDWVAAPYSTGHTQFGDAVQRAEFFSSMGANWHTLLNAPRVLKAATVEIPSGKGKVFKTASGVTFAEVDSDYVLTKLDTILASAGLRASELPIAVSRNVLLYTGGKISNCCVLGFHTVYQSGGTTANHILQTFAWASWLDAGLFQNSDVADVLPLSHEISEWMDDPFVNNAVPKWEFPDNSGCQADLETGDPVEVLNNLSIPVTVSGFTYHPQTEALLQWFSRQSPSQAIHGAYSYPDLSALRSPSKPCTKP